MTHCPSQDWDSYSRMMDVDETCCAHCGQKLPEIEIERVGFQEENPDWSFEGFCDAECAALFWLDRATFPGNTTNEPRQAITLALDNLAKYARSMVDRFDSLEAKIALQKRSGQL